MTFPINVSSMSAPVSSPAFFNAACVECTARSVPVKALSFPPNAPNGVRLAPTMKIPLAAEVIFAHRLSLGQAGVYVRRRCSGLAREQ